MGKYDNNFGIINISEGTQASCNNNYGRANIGSRCVIVHCNLNSGKINIGSETHIETITCNNGSIQIENNCHIGVIAGNSGKIDLGRNCVIREIKNNRGVITGGQGTIIPQASRNTGIINRPTCKVNGGAVFKTAGRVLGFHLKFANTTVTVDAPTGPRQVDNNYTPAPSKKRKVPDPPAERNQEHPDDDKLCSICMVQPKNMAFTCGHVCCESCAKPLTVCHMCRKAIHQKIKLFL